MSDGIRISNLSAASCGRAAVCTKRLLYLPEPSRCWLHLITGIARDSAPYFLSQLRTHERVSAYRQIPIRGGERKDGSTRRSRPNVKRAETTTTSPFR